MATNRWYTNSTNIIVDYTTAEASDVENKLNDVANALDTVEGEFDDLKEQSLKFNPSGGETPNTEYTGTLADMKETIVGFDSNGDMTLYPGDLSGFVWDGNVTRIDIDGATDIGADLTDADLIVVDDGATGTNRKSALSRVWTWLKGKTDAPIGMLDVKGGTDIGGALYGTDLVVVADPASGAVRKSALSRIWTFLKTMVDAPVSMLDIDGATDIGADLADADLIVVDDGASGTNRKATMARVATYVAQSLNAATLLRGTQNLLDNVSFEINNRNYGGSTIATGSTGTFNVYDRWAIQKNSAAAIVVSRNTTRSYGASRAALSMQISTPDGSLGAGEYWHLDSWLERDVGKVLQWGTASAVPAVLSAYLRVTGLGASTAYKIAAVVRGWNGSAINRACCVPITFTSDGSGNFEGRVTAVFPADTGGAWNITSSDIWGDVGFSFACGSTFVASSDSTWLAANYLGVGTQSNLQAISGVNVYISELMFVPGSVAPHPSLLQRQHQDRRNVQRYLQQLIFPSAKIENWFTGGSVGYLRVESKDVMLNTPTASWIVNGADFGGERLTAGSDAASVSGLTPSLTPESTNATLLTISSASLTGGVWGMHSAVGSIALLDADPAP
jgi:hypothetical protein